MGKGASLQLAWLGGPAPAALASRLAALGLELGRAREADTGPCAVATGRDRRPRAPRGRPWIWVPPRPVDDIAAAEAVLDGAYDVVPLSAPDAAAQLAARVR